MLWPAAYGIASWPRLVTACRMTDAIWRGDVEAVREFVVKNPKLLHESATGVPDSNWGPPMSTRRISVQDAIIQMLREHGSGRCAACLQPRLSARKNRDGAAVEADGRHITPGIVMGPCETLNDAGLALQLELGAELADEQRRPARADCADPGDLQPKSARKASLP